MHFAELRPNGGAPTSATPSTFAAPLRAAGRRLWGVKLNTASLKGSRMQDGHQEQLRVFVELDGEVPDELAIEKWDTRLESHLATFILRHLAEDPAPRGSRLAGDARLWAENLQRDAQARQVALGVPARLQAV